jgi:hypothetical protein
MPFEFLKIDSRHLEISLYTLHQIFIKTSFYKLFVETIFYKNSIDLNKVLV